jgi:hypothetical protein
MVLGVRILFPLFLWRVLRGVCFITCDQGDNSKYLDPNWRPPGGLALIQTTKLCCSSTVGQILQPGSACWTSTGRGSICPTWYPWGLRTWLQKTLGIVVFWLYWMEKEHLSKFFTSLSMVSDTLSPYSHGLSPSFEPKHLIHHIVWDSVQVRLQYGASPLNTGCAHHKQRAQLKFTPLRK